MKEAKQIRESADLTRPERLSVTRRYQREALKVLADQISNAKQRKLSRCDVACCGLKQCVEACWFGHLHNSRRHGARIYRLLAGVSGSVFEVRLVRGRWMKQRGHLNKIGIAAPRQYLRHALDSLCRTSIIAVGTFKLVAGRASFQAGQTWAGEIHLLAAGVSADELERVFLKMRRIDQGEVLCSVRKVRNLRNAIDRVLWRDLCWWSFPEPAATDDDTIPRALQRELYRHLINLKQGASIFKYGCGRQFQAAPRKPKPKKPPQRRRRVSTHLERFAFGSGDRWQNRRSPNDMGFNLAEKSAVDLHHRNYDESYFDDLED